MFQHNETVLIIAIQNGNLPLINLLFKYQTPDQFIDQNTKNAFLYAIESGKQDIINAFMFSNQSQERTTTYCQLVLSLTKKSSKEKIDIIQGLLSGQEKIKTEVLKNLAFDCCRQSDLEILSYCLKEGVDLKATKNDRMLGNTALLLSIRRGSPELTQALLKANANVNQVDSNGDTALLLSIQYGPPEITQAILALLKTEADINRANAQGISPLLSAVDKQNNELVKDLIKREADINYVDMWGSTPIRRAQSLFNQGLVKLLMSYKQSAKKNIEVDPKIERFKNKVHFVNAIGHVLGVNNSINSIVITSPMNKPVTIEFEGAPTLRSTALLLDNLKYYTASKSCYNKNFFSEICKSLENTKKYLEYDGTLNSEKVASSRSDKPYFELDRAYLMLKSIDKTDIIKPIIKRLEDSGVSLLLSAVRNQNKVLVSLLLKNEASIKLAIDIANKNAELDLAKNLMILQDKSQKSQEEFEKTAIKKQPSLLLSTEVKKIMDPPKKDLNAEMNKNKTDPKKFR